MSSLNDLLVQYEFVQEMLASYSDDTFITHEKTSELASQLSNLIGMLHKYAKEVGVADGKLDAVSEENKLQITKVNTDINQLKVECMMAMDVHRD